jgi:protein-S-isoprenylcysteine O-methyltransferase Ste14
MNDDNTFRLLLIALAATFLPLGLYHRLKAHTGEKIDRWQEGVVILFGLRLTAALAFVGGIAWLINPAWMAWSHVAIPVSLRWVGIASAVSSGAGFIWTVHHLGKNLTDTVITRKSHTLVTTGPYRWVRHPFYVAVLLGLFGVSFAMANGFILLAGSIVWFAFLLPRTRIEEGKLIERFGDDYRAYMRRVSRFIPRRWPPREDAIKP